jgi:hypothetical protein
MRKTVLAAAMALLPGLALAQQFDSGWRRIAPGDLANLELTGGGVRLNNFIVAPADPPREGQTLVMYSFSASAVKQEEGRRNVRVELVGVTTDRMPTVTSALAFNISSPQPNRTATDQHRFVALPADIAATDAYFIRVLVP